MTPERGFTLIELLLALAITALIGAASYAALDGVYRSRQMFAERAAALAQMQRFLTVIGRDLRMASAVQNRGQDGDLEAAFVLDDDAEFLLALNRRGWHNPLLIRRSDLQRVFYRVDDEQLIRGHWEVFDRSEESAFVEQTVLEKVADFSLRVLPAEAGTDLDRDWAARWHGDGEKLPAAVEINVELEALGQFRRIYELLPQD